MSDDEDDDDLFADFEDDNLSNANVSANLIDDIGKDAVAKRLESADDGRTIAWVAPSVGKGAGLVGAFGAVLPPSASRRPISEKAWIRAG